MALVIAAAVLLVIFDGISWKREPTETGWRFGGCLATICLIGLVFILLAEAAAR